MTDPWLSLALSYARPEITPLVRCVRSEFRNQFHWIDNVLPLDLDIFWLVPVINHSVDKLLWTATSPVRYRLRMIIWET